ncbi:MAG: ATP-binding protein [Erysipelotrichaceae bacterium]|nr:ATP-binding protein [Erysipelotrichaceae bacterium]
MFIGREKELQSLEEVYQGEGFGMTVIYGRRRIGKSTLITQFIKDKKAVFYTATKVGKQRNIELFGEQVMSVLAPAFSGVSFTTVESILEVITQSCSEEKLVLVLDEIPYWVEKDEGLLSILQKYIDTQWLNKNIMLILCGSALSFMENKVLSEKSPLFGRRTSQIKLEAFNYKDAAKFVPNYSYEEKAICYGITGGVAKYLSLLDSSKSLDENIIRLFFKNDGYLYDETRNLLTQEFTDITLVNNVIQQVADGETNLHVIADRLKEKEPTILYSLDKLINVGIVEKKKCITEENNKKKTQYVLKDQMFRFWYKYVAQAQSVIEVSRGDVYYEQMVKPKLHEFMGDIFEQMCRYYTLVKGVEGNFGNFITECGNWWGVERVNGIQEAADIDVVGLSMLDKTAVIGECKFTNGKIDKGIYDVLVRRSALITGKYRVTKMILFSLNGFTSWFDEVNSQDIVLVTLKDLYE